MTETTETVVVPPTKRPLMSRINKPRVAKASAIVGGVVLGGIWLKRKLNCECSVDATAHVETADQTDA